MLVMSPRALALVAAVALVLAPCVAIDVTFKNMAEVDAEIYYVPGEANLRGGPGAPDPVLIDKIEGGGGTVTLSSQAGHLFRVKIEDTVDERRVPSGETPAFFVVGVPESGVVRVACRLVSKGGEEGPPMNIAVHPAWSPRGAARFLDLVNTGFFDGVALNRVVPRFLTQFGIGATRWETRPNPLESRFCALPRRHARAPCPVPRPPCPCTRPAQTRTHHQGKSAQVAKREHRGRSECGPALQAGHPLICR